MSICPRIQETRLSLPFWISILLSVRCLHSWRDHPGDLSAVVRRLGFDIFMHWMYDMDRRVVSHYLTFCAWLMSVRIIILFRSGELFWSIVVLSSVCYLFTFFIFSGGQFQQTFTNQPWVKWFKFCLVLNQGKIIAN